MSEATAATDIIVFDSTCVFCTGNAKLVIRFDKARRFRFASMQAETGRSLLRRADLDPADPESMVVLTGERFLRDSDAVLHIYRHLGWPWRLAAIFRFVPRSLRDPAYRLVARNRYRWFGKTDSCWVPDAGDRERLL